MNSLAAGDFVIHSDHGLAEFGGIVRRILNENTGTKEYLKLSYADNDKLYVPVESAEKITKFIGDDVPKLTKLGASDWQRSQEKVKKETEKIAKELLKLYAARELAKGKQFEPDDAMLEDFCESFPYQLTPGQASAWSDVKEDLESGKPMDRLVCGDVGFGKTEIAMRRRLQNLSIWHASRDFGPHYDSRGTTLPIVSQTNRRQELWRPRRIIIAVSERR